MNRDGIRIRRSTDGDLPRLLDLWRRAVAATHDFVTPEHRAEIDEIVATQYLPRADLLVAVDQDDRPLAFLGGKDTAIDSLFVDPEFHGQGIGSRLVEEFARGSKGELKVDVNEQNESARRFYERIGFRVIGRSPLDGQGRPYPFLHMALRPRDWPRVANPLTPHRHRLR